MCGEFGQSSWYKTQRKKSLNIISKILLTKYNKTKEIILQSSQAICPSTIRSDSKQTVKMDMLKAITWAFLNRTIFRLLRFVCKLIIIYIDIKWPRKHISSTYLPFLFTFTREQYYAHSTIRTIFFACITLIRATLPRKNSVWLLLDDWYQRLNKTY